MISCSISKRDKGIQKIDKKRNRKLIFSEIGKLINQIKDEYKISQVYLFGSHAKLNFNSDSDIDVAIVFKDNIDEFDLQMKLMRLSSRINTRLEPHPFRAADFNKDYPLPGEILETGIRVV